MRVGRERRAELIGGAVKKLALDPAVSRQQARGMSAEELSLDAAQGGDEAAFARLVEPYRRELRAHCYRMSGSVHDADDLLQDSLLRAWRGLPRFERRSSLRTWLYRVTTTACLDALDKRGPRLLPEDLGPAKGPSDPFEPPRREALWLEPCPAALYAEAASPESLLAQRESVALAFLVALQHLPPKQRAVLLLRDVLGWQAAECADLLELSVASVNSALQRARETLARRTEERREPAVKLDSAEVSALLSRYIRAWELADIGALVALLHEDATLSMPPLPQWLAGRDAIAASIDQMVFAPSGAGAFRFVLTEANGLPAAAAYKRQEGGAWLPYAIHLLTADPRGISRIDAFIHPPLFAHFGLPGELGA
jgi:RNA polymerase sigma-70 factor (ECF subfamily)